MTVMAASADTRRLQWRCRRGMKELDVLLERYLMNDFAGASAQRQQAFAGLLELPDPVLHAYMIGRAVPEEEALRDVVGAITRSAP